MKRLPGLGRIGQRGFYVLPRSLGFFCSSQVLKVQVLQSWSSTDVGYGLDVESVDTGGRTFVWLRNAL